MQPHEAFKLGFLSRCVEEGLSPEQINGLAKSAAEFLGKQAFVREAIGQVTGTVKDTADAGKSVVEFGKSMWPLAALAVGVPAGAGALTAYLQNAATDVDATDVEEAKQQELMDTYRRMADQLGRKKQMRDYKQQRKRTGQVFL
jgi:DNA helicase TIP49 (TBP-interacting protein)